MEIYNTETISFDHNSFFVSTQGFCFWERRFDYCRKKLEIFKVSDEKNGEYWIIPYFAVEKQILLIDSKLLPIIKENVKVNLDYLLVIFLLSHYENIASTTTDPHKHEESISRIITLQTLIAQKLNSSQKNDFIQLQDKIKKDFQFKTIRIKPQLQFHVLCTNTKIPQNILQYLAAQMLNMAFDLSKSPLD